MRALIMRHFGVISTALVLGLVFAAASIAYPGFCSWFQFTRLFSDNASLGLAAIGMTFVILTGGIDLSVGAAIALASMMLAVLMKQLGLPIWIAIPAVLVLGAGFGAFQGVIIQVFELPSFLVTLAGMFLARGTALILTPDKRLEMSGDHAIDALSSFAPGDISLCALIFVAGIVCAWAVLRSTRLGRTLYAIGSDVSAARLMGLPVASSRIGAYSISGFCAAAGGIVQVIGLGAGDASAAFLLELDAIAAVVIGGTALMGGRGSVIGTLLGVLILAIITAIPSYQGNLNSWWIRIATGALLLLFVGLQRLGRRGE